MSIPRIPTELIAPVFNPVTFGIGRRDQVHSIFTTLRRDIPLGIAEVPGYDPYWIVTKYADVREITRQDDLFHSGDRPKTLTPKIAEQLIAEHSNGLPSPFRSLAHMDNPEHDEHRAITQRLFLPQEIARLEPMIRAIAQRNVEEFIAKGPEADFATDLAFNYPCEVILTMVGVPREGHQRILDLTHWMFNYADPDLCRPGASMENISELFKTWDLVYKDFKDFYSPIIADRQACPMKDIASVIANAKVGGCPLEERNMISYLITASTAGHDTTAATTANAAWVLAENPQLLERLKREPALMSGFIDESIRWASSVQHFVRSATQDYELRGQKIRKDDLLYISYISANYDEEVFSDPYTFNPDRSPNRHIGFGYGIHNCLGQHLARLEMRILWEELLKRIGTIELNGTPKMSQSEFICGPKSVPIRFSLQ